MGNGFQRALNFSGAMLNYSKRFQASEYFINLMLQFCFRYGQKMTTLFRQFTRMTVNLNAGGLIQITKSGCQVAVVLRFVTLKFLRTYLFLWGHELANSFRLFLLLKEMDHTVHLLLLLLLEQTKIN